MTCQTCNELAQMIELARTFDERVTLQLELANHMRNCRDWKWIGVKNRRNIEIINPALEGFLMDRGIGGRVTVGTVEVN